MIKSISYTKLELQMKKPFKISLGSTDAYEGFLVKVVSDDGFTGYGEATPTPFITGDTMGSIEHELNVFSKQLIKMDENPELINEKMKSLMKSAKASRNAVDTAIWDIIGKRSNISLKKMFGGYRSNILTSYTVDLVDRNSAKQQAKELLDSGIQVFKIKMGSGIKEDLDRVKAVREVIGPDRMVYVDFNQAYTAKKTVEIARKLEAYEIEFLEQPVPANDLKALKFVRNNTAIPVVADEAIFTPEDVSTILGMEAADGINIKLMKSGGITDSVKMVNTAESFRAPVMIGCMIETRLSNTAGLVVALAKKGVKYTDLDGYSSIVKDIAEKGIELKDGYISSNEDAGLGVTLKREYI
ncbi:MAG: dipeptide epimerase [Candidatus Thermoplasmatota archaeon]|nr:dipeptide epimerase [Candidatus Thermoplasmatota archaeon]